MIVHQLSYGSHLSTNQNMQIPRIYSIFCSKPRIDVQVAAACGVRTINNPNTPHIISISSIEPPTIDCLPAGASLATYPGNFIALPAQDLYKCSRCPALAAGTNYTVFLAATEGSSEYSGTAAHTKPLQIRTRVTPTVPRLLSEPTISSVNSNSITVTFQEQSIDRNTTDAVGVAYALTYARISAPFFPGYSLDFPVAEPSAEDIIAYARLGGAAALLPTAPPSPIPPDPPGGAPFSAGKYGTYGGYTDWNGGYGAAYGMTTGSENLNGMVAAGEEDASDTANSAQASAIGGIGGILAAGYIETSGVVILGGDIPS